MLRRRIGALGLAAALGAVLPSPALSQAQSDTARRVASGGDVFGGRDALTLGAFALAGVVAYHNDRGIARAFQRADVQDNTALRNMAAVFRNTGQPGVLLGGMSAYAIGRFTHRPALASAGLRVTEAIVVAGTLTGIGKVAAGRSRPFVTAGVNSSDFQWWRGRREGFTSMPSGHTSAAFAAASALAVEWRASWPGSARVAVPLLCAGAGLVGLSRIYNDKHWASDVMAGAALGTLSGSVVARWGRAHPHNRVDRWLLPVRVAPEADGAVRVGLSFPLALASPDAR